MNCDGDAGLDCWLMLFHREEDAKAETLKHATLAKARLQSLFLAGQDPTACGKRYRLRRALPEQGILRRLMIGCGPSLLTGSASGLPTALMG